MLDLRLYMLQRITALLIVPFVVGHLVLMVIVIQGGLSAAEILGRTKGSLVWFLFYGLFVIAVSIHGALGLRVVVHEWLGLKGRALEAFMWIVGLGLLLLGWRAVWAVTFAGGSA